MARLTIRIDLSEQASFGPGKARLLELLDDEGSIRRAAAAMGMSYRQAWQLLHDLERVMGAPIIAAATGGARGGGASLTKFGRAVLAQYRAIERKAGLSVATELRELVEMAKGPSHQRPRGLRAANRPLRKRIRRPTPSAKAKR